MVYLRTVVHIKVTGACAKVGWSDSQTYEYGKIPTDVLYPLRIKISHVWLRHSNAKAKISPDRLTPSLGYGLLA